LQLLIRSSILKAVIILTSVLTLFGLSADTPAKSQDDQCPALIETALAAVDQFCEAIGRNQACYGHLAAEAEPYETAPSFVFDAIGDVVDIGSMQSLRLSPFDVENGVWGVAVMKIQANLPNTLPGQNVQLVAFGDTELINEGEPIIEMTVTIATGGDNLNARLAPSLDSLVVQSIPNRETLSALGRSPNNEWLLVRLPQTNTNGWIVRRFITSEAKLDDLPIIRPDEPVYGPMQAFVMSTGVGNPNCTDVPTSGLLVQTPQGASTIELSINEIQVTFGSTLFITAQPGETIHFRMIEGTGSITVGETFLPIPAGGGVQVPLDEDLQPAGEPSAYEPYEADDVDDLPLDLLDRKIEPAEPASDEIADLVNEYGAYFKGVEVEDYDDFVDTLMDGDPFDLDEAEEFFEDHGYDVEDADDLFDDDNDDLSDGGSGSGDSGSSGGGDDGGSGGDDSGSGGDDSGSGGDDSGSGGDDSGSGGDDSGSGGDDSGSGGDDGGDDGDDGDDEDN
jgi:hypothetical protein